MRNIIFGFAIIITVSTSAQSLRDSVITLNPPSIMDVRYVFNDLIIQFNSKDILKQLPNIRAIYESGPVLKASMNVEKLFDGKGKGKIFTVTYGDPDAIPELISLDYLLTRHIAAALLKGGKASLIDRQTGQVYSKIKVSQRPYVDSEKTCRFSSMDGDFLFTGGLFEVPTTVVFLAPNTENESRVYMDVDKMPEPPGGIKKYESYLASQQKYSKQAREVEVSGKVVVQFIINTDGSFGNFTIFKSLHPDLDKEAIRLIREGGNFTPGSDLGKPVRVSYFQSVRFKFLESDK